LLKISGLIIILSPASDQESACQISPSACSNFIFTSSGITLGIISGLASGFIGLVTGAG